MSHYFDADPDTPSRPGKVSLRLADFSADLAVDRGVFSAGSIDPGTVELLRAGGPGGALPPEPGRAGGPFLDLGCGYGAIAVTLAHRHPAATVWAVDVNGRALSLCASNASALGVADRVRPVGPDEVPETVRFAEIWSNPPIRIGKAALHQLLERWLPRLSVGGRARLVVHKHLGSDSLAAWLSESGYPVRRASSRKGYRLLDVTAIDATAVDATGRSAPA